MRLWSIHPAYLDSKGLVALWREGLLAQKVLLGKTKGYTHHPQLVRFKNTSDPLAALSSYLWSVIIEADQRGYNFNRVKIVKIPGYNRLHVTTGQLEYEFNHLLMKLKVRAPFLYKKFQSLEIIKPHPLFTVVDGGVEEWEIITN